MAQFPFKGGHLIKVKITKKDKYGTAAGWPWPLNSGGHLIQVTNTACMTEKIRTLKTGHYIQVRLYCATGTCMYESVKVRVTH